MAFLEYFYCVSEYMKYIPTSYIPLIAMLILKGIAIIVIFHFIIVTIKNKNRPSKNLTGKHVVITGGSSGIGLATAIECVRLGANVTILARNLEKLLDAKQEIKKHVKYEYQVVSTMSIDVSAPDTTTVYLKMIDKQCPIYMLINCAGLAVCGTAENINFMDITNMINVNLSGTINTTWAIIGLMKRRGDGIIVNVSSQGGLVGIYGYSAYAASKFGVRGFTEALEMEVRPYGIYVTLALPPNTDTPGFATENLNKPTETRLISEAAGLVDPSVVAKQLVKDAIAGRFYSHVGFASALLTSLCVGLAPYNNLWQVYMQGFIIGPMRVLSSLLTLQFQRIVKDCHERKRMAVPLEDEEKDESNDEPIDAQTDEPIDAQIDELIDEPADEPVDEPIDEPVDEPIVESVGELVDEPIYEPKDKSV